MSAPLSLAVPQPTLVFKPVLGAYAPLEDVVTVSFPIVRFPDGSAMTAGDYAAARALLTRTLTAGSTADVWDPQMRKWRPLSGVDPTSIDGVPLVPAKAAGAAWSGTLNPADQTDSGGAPAIQIAVGNFPQYRLRGVFRARRDSTEAFGIGPDSTPIIFASADAAKRFAADLTPNADSATRARLVLRNPAAQDLAVLDMDASSGTTVITLSNSGSGGGVLASVALAADGSIVLTPAAGKRVIVAGDLETGRIRYQPVGGGAKQDLN